MTEWRTDIENAPKDGTDVLFPIEFVGRAYWCADLKRWVMTYPLTMEFINHPTRFRLPRVHVESNERGDIGGPRVIDSPQPFAVRVVPWVTLDCTRGPPLLPDEMEIVMPDTIERLATCARQLLDAGAEIERLNAVIARLQAAETRAMGQVAQRSAVVERQDEEIERLRAAATAFLLEQTDEDAATLAKVLGWVRVHEQGARPAPYPQDEPAEVTIRKDRDEWPL